VIFRRSLRGIRIHQLFLRL